MSTPVVIDIRLNEPALKTINPNCSNMIKGSHNDLHSDCPLCGSPANKSNTHLVPWFIVKRTVTEKGVGNREKQLSFRIGPGGPVRMHAARGVLPETLEALDVDHELVPEEEDKFARDYLWCARCEEKFSHLEHLFSEVFSENRLQAPPGDLEEHHGQRILVDVKYSYSLYELFIQSVFLRCSIDGFDGFKLEAPIEKKLLSNMQVAFQSPNFLKLKKGDELVVGAFFSIDHVVPVSGG